MPEVIESCDGRGECKVPKDIVEIAESMDEVRGIGRVSGPTAISSRCGDAVDRGDGGDEFPSGAAWGIGEETFLS